MKFYQFFLILIVIVSLFIIGCKTDKPVPVQNPTAQPIPTEKGIYRSITKLESGNYQVMLRVILGDVRYYIIDERLPANAEIINNGGGSTQSAGHLKWVMYHDATNADYVYEIKLQSGINVFTGVYQMEGMANPEDIKLDKQVEVP